MSAGAGQRASATPVDRFSRRAVTGALWNYGGFASTKAANLVTTIVLARYLTPAEFGVVALALVIVNYLDVVNNFGISAAVIFEPEDDDESASVAFWLSQGTGLLAFAVTAALAPVTASLFHMPELAPVQTVLGLAFVLGSLGSVHDARLRRRMQWRRRLPADVGRASAKVVVAVILALAGLGAFALVWSQLAAALVFSLVVIVALRWRPAVTWDWSIARRQLSFGGQLTLSSVLSDLLRDVDYLLIGALLSSTAVGFYTLGFRIPDVAVVGVTWAACQSVFPVFARLREDPAAIGAAIVRVIRVLALVTVPVATVLLVMPDQIVRVLFGPAWTQTADVVPFIAVYALMQSICLVGSVAFKAVGRAAVVTWFTVAALPVTVLVLWLVTPAGIVAVARGQVVLMAVSLLAQMVLVHRTFGIALTSLAGSVVPAALGSLALAGSLLVVEWIGWSPAVTLIVGLGMGAVVYSLVIAVIARSGLRELRALLRPTVPAGQQC